VKLDDTVCRGSLIIHKGESYVVIGRGVQATDMGHQVTPFQTWRIVGVKVAEAGIVADRHQVGCDAEVEMFFPGAVFPLSEFII
jgi:hypothetical protein